VSPTDKELLELSYKAAFRGANLEDDKDMTKHWNPLKKDSNALWLLVKLRISLLHTAEYVGGPVMETVTASSNHILVTECINDHGTDEMAATRRAIVRAAAEIGKQKD
jgi:hypothetical protein